MLQYTQNCFIIKMTIFFGFFQSLTVTVEKVTSYFADANYSRFNKV